MKLNNLKVQELNAQELRTVDGGAFPVAIWGLMVAIDAALLAVYATYDSEGRLKHK